MFIFQERIILVLLFANIRLVLNVEVSYNGYVDEWRWNEAKSRYVR